MIEVRKDGYQKNHLVVLNKEIRPSKIEALAVHQTSIELKMNKSDSKEPVIDDNESSDELPPVMSGMNRAVSVIEDKDQLENILEELTESNLCIICCLDPINTFLTPCGHKCMCIGCAEDLKNSSYYTCPICRKDIESCVTVVENNTNQGKVTEWKCTQPACGKMNMYRCSQCFKLQHCDRIYSFEEEKTKAKERLQKVEEFLKKNPLPEDPDDKKESEEVDEEVIELRAKIKDMQQNFRACTICFENEVNVAFYPCAHSIMCSQCSEHHNKISNKFEKCLVCSTPIEKYVVLYTQ